MNDKAMEKEAVPEENARNTPIQADAATGDIVRTAVLACFGSGCRMDALERMMRVSISLAGIVMSETGFVSNKEAILNRILRELSPLVGVRMEKPHQPAEKKKD